MALNTEASEARLVGQDEQLERTQLEVWANVQKHLKIGGWSLDLVTNTPYVTDQVKEIYQYPAELDLPLEDGINFYHEEDRPKIRKGVEDAISKGVPYDLTLRLIRYDKERIWVRARGFPIKDDAGNVVKLMGSLQDVTSEVTESEKREHFADRMRLALKVTHIGIWDWDVVNDHLVWDDQMYRLYGVEPSTFASAYEAWHSGLHPDDKDSATRGAQDALAGVSAYDTRFRIVHGDGSVRWIKALGQVFRDSNGEPVRMLGANMDISAEERAKRELHEQIKINQHQSKLAALGELAAGVGHEVNNPLAVIKGAFVVLSSALADADSLPAYRSRFASWEKKIDIACERIEKIVSGLRVFSRSDGDLRTRVDLRDAIHQAMLLTSEIYLKEGIYVQPKLPSEPCYVNGNVGRLAQVLINLLSNAKDAVLKNREAKEISLVLERVEGNFRIAVRDNGPGIPPEVKERVFESFFTTKPIGIGTGVGLSLAKKIAEEHGGDLLAESEIGKGSTFILELPVGKDNSEDSGEAPAQPKLGTETPKRHRRHRVLVIDDEKGVRSVFKALLVNLGCEVTTLAFVEKAQELLEREAFDFLFTDLNLPGMSGFELLDSLHGSEGAKRPRVIAMTGGVGEDVEKRLAEKVDAVLLKPFNMDKLERLLKLPPRGERPTSS